VASGVNKLEDLVLIATSERLTSRQLPAEFEVLFQEHYEFVHRTAYRVTGNFADAEDVIQTLFLRLCRQGFPASISTNPRAYLYRAAVNIALDIIRSRRRHPADNDDREILKVPAATEPSRGEEELHDRLRIALAELAPDAAEILILRHVHGYRDAEIAKLLGRSRSAVSVSLFRSRLRLKRSIRGR
jgi:RNA polymerase sigma-70 factor (ECF subfamily)